MQLKDYVMKIVNLSAHYFIKKNGDIINLFQIYMKHGMLENQVGKIIISLNKYSIGIEIHNPGHNLIIKIFHLKK